MRKNATVSVAPFKVICRELKRLTTLRSSLSHAGWTRIRIDTYLFNFHHEWTSTHSDTGKPEQFMPRNEFTTFSKCMDMRPCLMTSNHTLHDDGMLMELLQRLATLSSTNKRLDFGCIFASTFSILTIGFQMIIEPIDLHRPRFFKPSLHDVFTTHTPATKDTLNLSRRIGHRVFPSFILS